MRTILLLAVLAVAGCDYGNDSGGTNPTPQAATVTFRYQGPTALRGDLPASAAACAQGASPTHMHPSWRSFGAIPLQPVPPDRYTLTLTDVPINTVVSFRINDPNACDENPTGAVTRNIFANDVLLTTMVTTPGSGPEPGFSFRVTAAGQIQP